nr:hypothetical protein [uncultured Methanoregula sp.]
MVHHQKSAQLNRYAGSVKVAGAIRQGIDWLVIPVDGMIYQMIL